MARETIPEATRQYEASLRTPLISVGGDLEKRAFVRACHETQLSSRW